MRCVNDVRTCKHVRQVELEFPKPKVYAEAEEALKRDRPRMTEGKQLGQFAKEMAKWEAANKGGDPGLMTDLKEMGISSKDLDYWRNMKDSKSLLKDLSRQYYVFTGTEWKAIPTNVDVYNIAAKPEQPKTTIKSVVRSVTERIKRKIEL